MCLRANQATVRGCGDMILQHERELPPGGFHSQSPATD
jgi:hypothetical protein